MNALNAEPRHLNARPREAQPPAIARLEFMETLGGFPNPPAMGCGEPSAPADVRGRGVV